MGVFAVESAADGKGSSDRCHVSGWRTGHEDGNECSFFIFQGVRSLDLVKLGSIFLELATYSSSFDERRILVANLGSHVTHAKHLNSSLYHSPSVDVIVKVLIRRIYRPVRFELPHHPY